MGDARKTPLQERRCHQGCHHYHNEYRRKGGFVQDTLAVDHKRQADAGEDEPRFAAKQTYDRGGIN